MKKALLTTTALVALSGAAFADSVAAVADGGKSHHVHKPTVVWHGNANLRLNAPLIVESTTTTRTEAVGAGGVVTFTDTTTTSTNKSDIKILSDVDLDVEMTSVGAYTAKISADISGGSAAALGANATITVATPTGWSISVGTNDAAGGAGGGADASDMYADIDHMSNVGADEDSSDWYVKVPFGGWTVAASGERDQTVAGAAEKTSIGLSGAVGGLKITAGGMHKSGGASVETSLMGATVTVAMASIHNGTKANQESGVQVKIPLGGMDLTVNSTTTAGSNNWGASVSTKVGAYAITAGTDSDQDSQFSLKGPLGPVTLHVDWDSSDSALTKATDATIEAGVTYAVPGTNGTTISASYSNDDDDFDAGTQVKMAFSF